MPLQVLVQAGNSACTGRTEQPLTRSTDNIHYVSIKHRFSNDDQESSPHCRGIPRQIVVGVVGVVGVDMVG
ncbi:MAG: hypothetical protein ABF473_09980, partial [Bifidobacterium psychraerophilum]